VPANIYAASDPDWKKNAAQVFVFNSIQPYMKNLQMLKCPGGVDLRTTATFAPASGVPTSGSVNVTYTYNGLLNGWNATAIAAAADLTVFWHGHGKRSLYALGYASPWLNCNDLSAPCIYVAPKSSCNFNVNGETGGYTTRTGAGTGNRTGVNVFNGIIITYADSHAKAKKLGAPSNDPNQRTDPRQDPWARYDAQSSPRGRYWDQYFCHPYFFRPDFDFSTAETAVYVDGGADPS
jgi:hypothetical protein